MQPDQHSDLAYASSHRTTVPALEGESPMTQAETELLLALFALYAYECLFWLRPDEQGYTRTGSSWRPHPLNPQSFTMLRRRAVLADPLLLHPGFVRMSVEDGPGPSPSPSANPTFSGASTGKAVSERLARIAQDLDDFSLLTTQCRIQAVLLLLVLPALLWTHHLTPWWREYAGLLLFNHALLCWWLFRALRILPQATRRKLLAPALLNPLGATRVFDPLGQALFEASLHSLPPKKK